MHLISPSMHVYCVYKHTFTEAHAHMHIALHTHKWIHSCINERQNSPHISIYPHVCVFSIFSTLHEQFSNGMHIHELYNFQPVNGNSSNTQLLNEFVRFDWALIFDDVNIMAIPSDAHLAASVLKAYLQQVRRQQLQAYCISLK